MLRIILVICLAGLLLISAVLLPRTVQTVGEMHILAAQDEVTTVDSANLQAPCETDIFVSGQGGYHTYRIPAIVVSQAGTILALCEGRKHSSSDSGDIDLLLRRSFDNGRTWQPKQVIWDNGEDTIGNPCPVVDQSTGTIWLPFCRNNDRVYVTRSIDDGNSWSSPVDITSDLKLPSWDWYATGPGHGIQLSNGRLLIPCDHRLANESSIDRGFRSHVFYSDDHGSTWQLGGIVAKEFTDECEAVQTVDGAVYLNIRRERSQPQRMYAWSDNEGEAWSEAQWDETLIGTACQASVVRFTNVPSHAKNRVLFSNPASTSRRERLTIRLSYDECQTWSAGKMLWPGPAAYSDLCVLPDMTICCLYEGGDDHPYENIRFARFTLEWLTDGADQLAGARVKASQ